MAKERIHCSQIKLGQPLLWDLYGSAGELLLRKGHVVCGAYQIQQLHTRSLYVQMPARATVLPVVPPPARAAPSAMTLPPAKAPPPVSALPVALPSSVRIAMLELDAAAARADTLTMPSVMRMLDEAVKRLDRVLHAMLRTGGDKRQELLAVAHLVRTACSLHGDVALASILHGRADNYPVRHGIHAAIVALHLARALKRSQADQFSIAQAALAMNLGMLHYHGELGASEAKLSPKMMEMVHDHPQQSVQLLRRAGVTDAECLTAVMQHHENDDGSGYPFGKRGDAIAQSAKIVALADRYCAAVSERRYRRRLLPHEALRDIFLGKTIAPALLALSVRELGIYPVGTMVRLVNGEVGIVIGRDGPDNATPLVASLQGPRGAALPTPIRRDTGTPLQAIREVLNARSAGVEVVPVQIWGELAAL